YSFKLLPIGASVQFAGEYSDEEAEDVKYDQNDPTLFFNRPRWARAIVVACGPLANFVTAFLAFVIMFTAFGVIVPKLDQPPSDSLAYEAGVEAGDKLLEINDQKIRTAADYSMIQAFLDPEETINLTIESKTGQEKHFSLQPRTEEKYRLGISQGISAENNNVVIEVDPNSNQAEPVLEVGDKILSINGVPFSDQESIAKEISQAESQKLSLTVLRDGEAIELSMVTTLYNDPVSHGLFFTESKSFGDILYQSVHYPWSIVKSTIKGLGMVFTGESKFSESVTGPVGIVKMFGDVVSDSPNIGLMVYQLLFYFSLISVAIGFTNLLPIPPLDGHHLLILAIEGIRRKDLPDKFKHVLTAVGLILILLLAIFVIYFDIRKII
ncbi:MAG TPA: RIP metalloprotease RseP, partial [Candidatus Eisenbacteria bacterium]|nr:RIP metalloprotease RseP [Candidatus Eisenbacteria bacterium]